VRRRDADHRLPARLGGRAQGPRPPRHAAAAHLGSTSLGSSSYCGTARARGGPPAISPGRPAPATFVARCRCVRESSLQVPSRPTFASPGASSRSSASVTPLRAHRTALNGT
jgi:hypothetical protein